MVASTRYEIRTKRMTTLGNGAMSKMKGGKKKRSARTQGFKVVAKSSALTLSRDSRIGFTRRSVFVLILSFRTVRPL